MCTRPLVAAAVLVLGATMGWARDLSHDEVLRLRRSGELLALEELLERARARHPGATLLETELERKKDVLIYELELLTVDGQVRELKFDARNGTLLSDQDED